MTVRTLEAAHGTDGGQFVVTRLGNESYAIAITAVREIVRMPRMTEIPLTDDYFMGLTKLRETVIPVAELRRSLGLQAGDTAASGSSSAALAGLAEPAARPVPAQAGHGCPSARPVRC